MYQTGYETYRKTDVITADSKKLVLLCYEETIRCLNVAKASYLSNDYEAKGKSVLKALEIISELRSALDFERGGEIARNLDLLYGFMTRHIMNADRGKDLKAFSQVIRMLEELKSAWQEAFYGRPEGAMLHLQGGPPGAVQSRGIAQKYDHI